MKRKFISLLVVIGICAAAFFGCTDSADGDESFQGMPDGNTVMESASALTDTTPISTSAEGTCNNQKYVLSLKSDKGFNVVNNDTVIYTASVTADGVPISDGSILFKIFKEYNDGTEFNTVWKTVTLVNGKAVLVQDLCAEYLYETQKYRVKAIYKLPDSSEISTGFNQIVGTYDAKMKVEMSPTVAHGGETVQFTVSFNIPGNVPIPAGEIHVLLRGAVSSSKDIQLSGGKATFPVTFPKSGPGGAVDILVYYQDKSYQCGKRFMVIPEYNDGEQVAPGDAVAEKPATSSKSADGYTITLSSDEGYSLVTNQPVVYTAAVKKDDGTPAEGEVKLSIEKEYRDWTIDEVFSLTYDIINGKAEYVVDTYADYLYDTQDLTVKAIYTMPNGKKLSTSFNQNVGYGKPSFSITQNPQVICAGDTATFIAKLTAPAQAPAISGTLNVTFVENGVHDPEIEVPMINGTATFTRQIGTSPVEVRLYYTDSSYRTASVFTVIASKYRLGDVNDDGSVDAIDMALLKKYLLNESDSLPHQDYRKVADVNGDGNIDSIDFALIKSYLLGKITNFPADM